MARPKKRGLDYFSHDVDMGEDDKIYVLEAETGLKGYALWVKLLEKIYKDGYYLKWDERTQKIFARKNNCSPELVSEVVNVAINEGLFSQELYEQYSILTSKSIQERYLQATSRRKEVPYNPNYLLVSVNGYDNLVNVHKNPQSSEVDSGNKEQSKVKESKVNNKQHIVSEDRDKSTKEDKSPKFDKESTEYQLALELRNRIADWHDPVPSKVPDPNPVDMNKWSKDMDKLLRLGPVGGDKGPTEEQVEYIIHWIYDIDDFWRDTIQSPHGIRKHLSKITAQIRRHKRKQGGNGKYGEKTESEYMQDLINSMEGE